MVRTMALKFKHKFRTGKSNFSDENRRIMRERLKELKRRKQSNEGESEENRFSTMQDEQRELIDALEDGFPALSKRLSSMHQ